ncbi:ABC transporter permease [Christensenella intestinihominis]|uniref:ABC transporter permease n=1 Tax=Christensenella intestinihominis TaxID=1851429 RepID=UPI000834FAFD|nr:ABC transporter permease [Christensenella intestinihominis]
MNKEFAGERHLAKGTLKFLRKNVLLVFLIIIVVIIAFSEKSFFTSTNLLNILRQITVAGIMVCGTCFVLVSGTIDLSVGGNLTLSLCIMAVLVPYIGIYPAMLVCMAVAVGCAVANGILVSRVVVNDGTPFIITFGTMTAMYAAALIITSGYNNKLPSDPVLDFFGKGMVGIIPFPVILFIAAVILCQFILTKTPFGRRMYFLGVNPEASRLSGIHIANQRILGFAIEGVCIGLSAIILGSRVGSVIPSIGNPYDFDVLTMAIVGGVMLGGGRGNILGAFIGTIVIGVLTNAMSLLNISDSPQEIVKGILIIVAVWLDTYNKGKDREASL